MFDYYAGPGRRGITAVKLVDKLRSMGHEIEASKVQTWREAKALPAPHLIQTVAKALRMEDEHSDRQVVEHFGYDPMVMVRLLGLIPEDEEANALLGRVIAWQPRQLDQSLVERVLDLESLDLKIAEREEELLDVERDRGAPSVVRNILASQRYGVALWPVIEGPSQDPLYRLHVSDRVDIRRVDGDPIDNDDVWKKFGPTLGRAGALKSISHPRWPGTPHDYSGENGPDVSRWNLRRLDVPRRPQIHREHAGFPALVCSATVSASWVGHLASLLALVLGYGLTSTVDLARRLGSEDQANPNTEERNRVHHELLRNPGTRRVWYHPSLLDEANSNSPWAPLEGTRHRELVHIRLVESHDFLEEVAKDRARLQKNTQSDDRVFMEWKKSRDLALERIPQDDRHLQIPVTKPVVSRSTYAAVAM